MRNSSPRNSPTLRAATSLCAQDARRASPDADEIDGHTLFLHQHLRGLALVLDFRGFSLAHQASSVLPF